MPSDKRPNGQDKLTPRQAKFVNEYMLDLNATKAAARAGYSEKTAGAAGGRLLQNVKIQAALNKRMTHRTERTEITQDFVLTGICRNIQQAENAEEQTPAHVQAAMRGYELLGRHLAMFTDKVKATHDGSIALEDVWSRVVGTTSPIRGKTIQ